MASTDGSEDVNDFLQRIKEMGDRRDQEDEERNRKLEEEILQGRKERQARRAERARSISPTKSSPSTTPTTSRISTTQSGSLSRSNTPTITPRATLESREAAIDDAMDRLTGSPAKENTAPSDTRFQDQDSDVDRGTPMKNSMSNAMPSRTPTLSWQQRRPNSQASDRTRSRPLSVIATENAARSPRETPEPVSNVEETMSRDQIAQSLAAKDPTWFRQTTDRGLNSPAYRKNQVEDQDRAEHGASAMRVQMPGMTRGSPQAETKEDTSERSSSPARTRTSYHESRSSENLTLGSSSPFSLTPAQKLDPPTDSRSEARAMAMSPSQGRISPERLERAPSPTKGMGGFVQSAMMKRSDSVSKRWSVQSPTGLHRGNSVASNRSSQDIGIALQGDRSRDNSHEPNSRPGSSHSNATITQDRPSTSNSVRGTATSSTSEDVFVKPSLPASRSRSPTKASWLESALNKPDSPKPKVAPPPQQPSWMVEINKAKKKSVDLGQSASSPPKHEVNIGGLLRSPPPGGSTNLFSVEGLHNSPSPSLVSTPLEGRNSQNHTPPTSKISHNGTTKIKPETPPKKDFRAGLKPRQVASADKTAEEPEFKNVFGQLKRTKTQNYVAPDTLKDNITRGKNALNVTGGPVKTERRDEFRDAILKKKEDFKTAQAEGKGVVRPPTEQKLDKSIPEALLKRQEMAKQVSNTSTDSSSIEPSVRQRITPNSPKPSLLKETSAPGRLQGKESVGNKLASRFNPGLADLLAKGPPSIASETSRSSSPAQSTRAVSSSTATTSNAEVPASGPQLIHMTKGRARGPRRKAPSSAVVTNPISGSTSVGTSLPIQEPKEKSSPTVKAKPQPSPKPVLSPKPESTSNVEPSSQPSSPRKLDMKRRSQFLQDAASKAEPSSPRPVSPVKRDFKATPVRQQENKTDTKVKPETPVKSPSLKFKSSPGLELGFKDATVTQYPTVSSSSSSILPLRTKVLNESTTGDRSAASVSEVEERATDSPISVRGAAAMWTKTPEAPTRTKSPIKLPTHADEKAALIEAGLRSPSPEKARPNIGLGIQTTSTRPLPVPPMKSVTSDSSRTGVSSKGPSDAVTSAPQPTSDASHLLLDFFVVNGPAPKYSADTTSLLSSRPDHDAHIKTLRSSLFQLSPDGKKQAVPIHQERTLFEGNLYLCFHTYGNSEGKKVSEIYYWIGDDVSDAVANEAKVSASREARSAGAELVVIKQGNETAAFFSALGGIIIIRRGLSSKYDSLAPHILCGRKHFGHIAFDEVDFAASSLCSGFAYLISTQAGKSYLWRGRGVHADELSCARLIGMDFGVTGDIEEIEDGSEPDVFVKIFGEGARIPKSADHWRLKPSYNRYCGRLFLASDAKEQITEISPYRQADLSPRSVYILDGFFEIYIITGHQAQNEYAAFHNALSFAQEYGILAASMEDRPRIPFTTVVMEGVPKDMKSLFRKWNDAISPTVMQSPGLQRGRSLRVVGLNAALEAAKV